MSIASRPGSRSTRHASAFEDARIARRCFERSSSTTSTTLSSSNSSDRWSFPRASVLSRRHVEMVRCKKREVSFVEQPLGRFDAFDHDFSALRSQAIFFVSGQLFSGVDDDRSRRSDRIRCICSRLRSPSVWQSKSSTAQSNGRFRIASRASLPVAAVRCRFPRIQQLTDAELLRACVLPTSSLFRLGVENSRRRVRACSSASSSPALDESERAARESVLLIVVQRDDLYRDCRVEGSSFNWLKYVQRACRQNTSKETASVDIDSLAEGLQNPSSRRAL